MAGEVKDGFRIQYGFNDPRAWLDNWSFVDILRLYGFEGVACLIDGSPLIDLYSPNGDLATMAPTVNCEIVELIHARKFKPWVRDTDHNMVKNAVLEASEVYPDVFVFSIDQELRQVNISSFIDLACQPYVDSVELLKRRWKQAASLYRTSLAKVVVPFHPVLR
jgi:hypothetical protein